MTAFRQTPLPFIVLSVILDLHAICDETRIEVYEWGCRFCLHGPWARATEPHGEDARRYVTGIRFIRHRRPITLRTTITRWEISLEKPRDWFLTFFEGLFEMPRVDRTHGKRHHFINDQTSLLGKARLSITNTSNHCYWKPQLYLVISHHKLTNK